MQMLARGSESHKFVLQANMNIPYRFTGSHLLDSVSKAGMKARNAIFILTDRIVVTQVS